MCSLERAQRICGKQALGSRIILLGPVSMVPGNLVGDTWSTFCIGTLLKRMDKLLAQKLPPTINVTASLSCYVLTLCLEQELRSSEQDRESALEGLRVQSENSSKEEL